ncbi:MAG: hypothetical protein LH647_15170, partial [Leptolyngbyaceae cyanobacterium CAN_BIN12]|nr:hypothetical protein [Leptolyngbyaceae cyanobacterium CAN_BIN12]
MESKTEKKNCLQCGVEIIKNTTTQEKWDIKTTCSAECRKAFRKGKVLKETEPKTCSNCMKLY